MEKKEQLYEGKAKKVYATEDPNLVIVSYKDDATAFDGAKKGTIVGKGVINNQMTNRLMAKMERPASRPTLLKSSASATRSSRRSPSSRWRSSSATSPPVILPPATAWRRASSSPSPRSSSPTRTTICMTP